MDKSRLQPATPGTVASPARPAPVAPSVLSNRSAPAGSSVPGPIGLDLGAAGARMIQFVPTGAAPAVRAAAASYRPSSDNVIPGAVLSGPRGRAALRDEVQRLLESAPFTGRRVVAAVPKDLLHVRTVRLPAGAGSVDPVDRTAFIASIRHAAGGAAALFPFDLRDAVVQVLPTGRVGPGQDARWEVIVLAAPRRELDGFVANLHAAGLVVESLDAEPCALYRSLTRAVGPGDDEPAQVMMDVGRRRSQVVIGRGGGVTFIKPIEVGAQHLDQAVVRKLGVTPAEARLVRRRSSETTTGGAGAGQDAVRQALCDATRPAVEQLARGLSAYLRYHAVTFRGPGPQRVYLAGGHADDELLRSSLSALLGLPVVPGDPLAGLDTAALPPATPADRATTGAWAVAAGLALKKLPAAGSAATRLRH